MPMRITIDDFEEVDCQSSSFNTKSVQQIIIDAFGSSTQVRGQAIRKIQEALTAQTHTKKVSVAIYETARQNSTSISFYSKNWITFKFKGIRLIAWTNEVASPTHDQI